ncbi:MAG: cyclic pyranopterin monophosphate synthase MoaC [Deltaproteobacteria bacterium]|nr:cyclic pyranopterin monophosphate synthase MoaC [Deltaproteobacteria bacterium]
MGMVDVSEKKVIPRSASARGRIILNPQSIAAIRQGQVKKGDPLAVAEVAGMTAAKQTSLLIPHCHQLPLDQVNFDFVVTDEGVEATCQVKCVAKTGVEMEALVGVTMALNTILDMVKYLEKDDKGLYPTTVMTDIRVISKIKG